VLTCNIQGDLSLAHVASLESIDNLYTVLAFLKGEPF